MLLPLMSILPDRQSVAGRVAERIPQNICYERGGIEPNTALNDMLELQTISSKGNSEEQTTEGVCYLELIVW